MKKTVSVVFFVLCFCGLRLEAQEAVSGGWPALESKQEVSRSVSVAMTANTQRPMQFISPVVHKRESDPKSGTESLPPFPVLISQKIIYPRKAIRKGWEGQTVIAVEVLPDGAVGRTALAKTSGHEELDRAAQDAIKTWKFTHESKKDDLAPEYVDIPVTFKLEDGVEG